MTKKKRDELKEYFQTGKVPTQKEFADLIDSFVSLDEDGLVIDGNKNVGIGTEAKNAKLNVAGKITAQEFQGSGQAITDLNPKNLKGEIISAQISELEANKIRGTLHVDQIPQIPSSKIESSLHLDQIPSLRYYIDQPIIAGEKTVTMIWKSSVTDQVTLEYVFEDKKIVVAPEDWKFKVEDDDGGFWMMSYQWSPYETATYTLTAHIGREIPEQKQFSVQVIPNEFQFLKSLYYQGISLSTALDRCLQRYNLLPLNQSTINRLLETVDRTRYSSDEAKNYLENQSGAFNLSVSKSNQLANPIIVAFRHAHTYDSHKRLFEAFSVEFDLVAHADHYLANLFYEQEQEAIIQKHIPGDQKSAFLRPLSNKAGNYSIQLQILDADSNIRFVSEKRTVYIEPSLASYTSINEILICSAHRCFGLGQGFYLVEFFKDYQPIDRLEINQGFEVTLYREAETTTGEAIQQKYDADYRFPSDDPFRTQTSAIKIEYIANKVGSG